MAHVLVLNECVSIMVLLRSIALRLVEVVAGSLYSVHLPPLASPPQAPCQAASGVAMLLFSWALEKCQYTFPNAASYG